MGEPISSFSPTKINGNAETDSNMNIESSKVVRLPEGFNPIPGQEVSNLDETVQLIGADGREYRGCLIDGFGSNEGCYWAEWIGPSGLEERVGKEQPIGWKVLPSTKHQN